MSLSGMVASENPRCIPSPDIKCSNKWTISINGLGESTMGIRERYEAVVDDVPSVY